MNTDPDIEVFPNAPITEAVLEFQVRLKGDAHLGQLALVQEKVKGRYPQRRESRVLSGGIQLAANSLTPWTSAEAKQVGFTFVSPDGKQILHARLNAFGYSRLKPYASWKEFRREALDLWGHFKSVAQPERVTRVGLRYINRVELPLPINDFADYVLTKLDIAPGLPDAISAMALTAVLNDTNTGSGIILNQSVDPRGPESGKLPLIFDIDAFKETDLDPDGPDLWTLVSELRKLKDDFFFKSFTEKAKELFR